uniref:Uncharacterized protein n=1 Tax=Anguilla anguilla TaxID=7936 RepID=A0A0E9X8H0_ANGAN
MRLYNNSYCCSSAKSNEMCHFYENQNSKWRPRERHFSIAVAKIQWLCCAVMKRNMVVAPKHDIRRKLKQDVQQQHFKTT